ncbi:MAG: trypsin-like peptidase domain-containing protein [Candidatus Acidiferrales bacterium]
MNPEAEKIVVVESDSVNREHLRVAMETAGYQAAAFATSREALDALRQYGADIVLLDGSVTAPDAREFVASLRGTNATGNIRVILFVDGGPSERAAGMDLGVSDAISRPADDGELLSRVRARLRMRRLEQSLLEKTRIAEEGQQIAHQAFEALAVTEKMASDATSLDRGLKIGVGVIFAAVLAMVGVYFLFAHTAQKESQRSNLFISKLEGTFTRQQDLIEQARKLREQSGAGEVETAAKQSLQKQAADIQSKMAAASPDESASLQKQLAETNSRLQKLEQQGLAAQAIIPADVQSVCLLHVAVAFNDKNSGKRLRYAGLNQDGDPLQDSDGKPVLTLDGNGPEVKIDVFGTGFLAGPDGRVITNRHVAEPWWKNDEMDALTKQGLQAQISTIRAYFPNDPRSFKAEINDISKETDLAAMRVDMQNLRRSILTIDSKNDAARSGSAIILMGYATGLAAILARTDEDTAQQIMKESSGDVNQVLGELAKRNLIRPLITQGHIGDVLPDKIVFDAQTTSGGSGGPLFNREGKVIGVTYAVLKGFGGSNFGIPIRFSQPLLTSH